MPCRGKANANIEYQDNLDQITEIINKYSSAVCVILLGDLNASLVKDGVSSRNRLLREFCAEFGYSLT